MGTQEDLEVIFHPRTVAVVGAPRKRPPGWPGIFGSIRDYGYKGRLYPINPSAPEVEGVRTYPDLVSVPEPIDLVIISVPAPAVPAALRDCIASGNRNVHIFTAGFKETGEEEGLRLHREIELIAREGGLNVIGPNCMGVFIPSQRLVTWIGAPEKSGPVAFVSQSGGHAQDFTNFCARLGIGFSKVISFGNALTLDSTDFLEYLAGDPDTEIITMYLEGVRDGRRLLDLVSRINPVKPVIILKAGLTEAGVKAVASHTGSLAGGGQIWDAFFKEGGAVRAYSLEDMAFLALAFRHLKTTEGLRVAVIGHGGGIAVSAADACSSAGLEMPPFGPETERELRSFIPAGGNIIKNPVDAMPIFRDLEIFRRMIDLIASEPLIDMLIVSLSLDWLYGVDEGRQIRKVTDYLSGPVKEQLHGKPLVASWRTYRNDPAIRKVGCRLEKHLIESGVPVYRGFEQASMTLARWANYHTFLRGRG
ncbi:MAG: CoA-binding protein [Deltaproteobacteria bacterium]|nr:CoA-binding protein [Deltaproteobacteria bacterium]